MRPIGGSSPERFRGRVLDQYFRALPQALVVFPNGPWEMIIRDSHAEITGLYRVRVSAYAYQAAGRPPVVTKVMVTNFVQNRFAAAFDLLSDEPRVMERTVRGFAQKSRF